jgi:hypothetical protein
MSRACLIALAVTLAAAPPAPADDARTLAELRAADRVRRLGGKIEIDFDRPGAPVVAIDLRGRSVSDDDLADVAVFKDLLLLDLARTGVGDAGLAHLAGLRELRELDLYRAERVGDAGLAHLKGLPRLRELDVSATRVGDAGLAHLAEVRSLRLLWAVNTRATEAGLDRLRRAVPGLIVNPVGGDRG